MRSPVLFLVFNRPEKTRAVFDVIRQAAPSRLYVAADGPRIECLDEARLCREVREAATAVDWFCEVKTLFREENLGCGKAVSAAIDWFFSHEQEGIILEDDIMADRSFFRYCDELLHRFRDDERIMAVTGDYFRRKPRDDGDSYFFSRYPHMWGWATWRRAWRHYDFSMSRWPELKNSEWLDALGGGYHDFTDYWTRIFDRTSEGRIDTWDYQWFFSCWLQNGLAVTPSRNLCVNIGFGKDATHTKSKREWRSRLPLETMPFPLRHPESVFRDADFDRWLDMHLFQTRDSFRIMIHRKLGRLKRKKKLLFGFS
ncbi:nucleotide-diphospho-sugar transferase [Prosthecochloris sp. GSB1]|uniref:nucleotide-diphospho-sugar transferase n=1 Tax=Prosthecochloris sp. GSB1 TaxID=281093 RepID=UPI0012374FF3|nr:nucleotide-diphospho-sugar transferase [Prosthecochloris sp. GSB1]